MVAMKLQFKPVGPCFKRMRILLCVLLWLVLSTTFSHVCAANPQPSISMSLEAEEVYIGDTILIVIESIGLIDPLDVSVLSNSARFERETTGTRISVQQGKVVEVKLRRMEFTPEKTGSLVFGPVTAGEVSSNSVSVTVLDKVRSNWTPSADDLSIDVKISQNNPYIYSQVVLDINLKHRYPITEEEIVLPPLTGFTTRSIFEKRRTFTDDSHELRQITWRYLLFPDRSGPITIEPLLWTGTTIKSRPERAQFNRSSTPLSLTVAPSRTGIDQWWLPTDNLTLSETWSTEPTQLSAGDEITRTLDLEARNVLAGQIPTPVIHESRALSQTLVSTDRSEEIKSDGVIATATFVYRVKAQSPIPVFLDTVRVVWWNTSKDEAAEKIIPARRINVGLPDRADLLKKIALTETGVSIFDRWWTQADRFRIALYLLALLSIIAISLTAFHAAFVHSVKVLSHRRQRNLLMQLAIDQKWASLAIALSPYYKAPFNNKSSPVINKIQESVFGNSDSSLNIEEINQHIMLLDLTQQATKTSESTLASL